MSETYSPDNLIAGDFPIVTATAILAAGILSRGAVLGKKYVGAVPATGTADGDNTGDGTVTVVTGGVDTKVGVYTIECIEAITNGGVFKVVNPNGETILENVIIEAGAGGDVAFTSDELNGTITDGGTDFALGDKFTVTVPAGDNSVVLVDSTAIDGSAAPYAVLLEDANASSAEVTVPVALSGEFDASVLSYGGTDTNATHKDAMRALNMYQKTTSQGGLSV
jgi:hypothetical protein